MLQRRARHQLETLLAGFPAVALIGPRQVGKTTLARQLAAERAGQTVLLDLERPSDLAKLAEPELYLAGHADKQVIIDEVQHRPDLFPVLRALIDEDRRAGRFLVLGSAAPALLRQSSESLAGRIAYLELAPFSLAEVGAQDLRRLWLRGGYPLSFLATDDAASQLWREEFVRSHLERDLPQLGLRVPAANLRRFWQMLAHHHGQLWNGAAIAGSLGVSAPTVANYLDILEGSFMVRRLPPFVANLKKRLVKSPKIYIRDSGLLHALLGLGSFDALSGHPIVGASWEGWAIEQILALAPRGWEAAFYRTAAGAEIDLVLTPPGGGAPTAVEIKYSTSPLPTKGFWNGLEDLAPRAAYVVAPVAERYPLARGVEVVPAAEIDATLFRG